MNTMHELHLRKAEAARTALQEARTTSKNDPNVYALDFDLEKALPFPKEQLVLRITKEICTCKT